MQNEEQMRSIRGRGKDRNKRRKGDEVEGGEDVEQRIKEKGKRQRERQKEENKSR